MRNSAYYEERIKERLHKELQNEKGYTYYDYSDFEAWLESKAKENTI